MGFDNNGINRLARRVQRKLHDFLTSADRAHVQTYETPVDERDLRTFVVNGGLLLVCLQVRLTGERIELGEINVYGRLFRCSIDERGFRVIEFSGTDVPARAQHVDILSWANRHNKNEVLMRRISREVLEK